MKRVVGIYTGDALAILSPDSQVVAVIRITLELYSGRDVRRTAEPKRGYMSRPATRPKLQSSYPTRHSKQTNVYDVVCVLCGIGYLLK